ncbi:MAG: hypothetical protein AAF437_11410 [Pseudomonadota bacterium]
MNVRFADLGLLQPGVEPGYKFSDVRQEIILPFVGAFVIDGKDTVLVERAEGVTDDFLAVPLLGPVLAIFMHLRRQFVLHGSAVIYNGKAYGFVGHKGAGKSTIAAMLLKNPNVEFLTDDLLVVTEKLAALRGYPQMKLSDEALLHSDRDLGHVRPRPIDLFPKNQYLLHSHAPSETVPVGGIFELCRASDAKIEHLDTQQAIRTLLIFSYMARFEDRQMSLTEKQDLFRITTQIAASGRVNRLHVPDSISELDQVIALLDS